VWAIADPITETVAKDALRIALPELDRHLTAGQIEIVQGTEWYLNKGQFDLDRLVGGWDEKLRSALAKGYAGMRASGNAFWFESDHWKQFCEYEHELNTYSLQASRAVDMLDVARAHQCSITRRNGDWEFLESPELAEAKQEIRKLNGALDILSKPFPGHDSLTPRERVALAQIVRGASSKEAARTLGISPRTVDFHRANMMQKLGARNIADLVRRVIGE
jgi:DNA-binding CsgD family transcriptional regulator